MKTKKNYEEAFIWYKKAAEHNNSPESYYAQSRLAYLLKNGLGVTKNYPAGMAWTKRAAQKRECKRTDFACNLL